MLFSNTWNPIHYGTEIDIWSVGMVLTEIILGYNFTLWKLGNELIERLATIFNLSLYNSKLADTIVPRGLSRYLTVDKKKKIDPLLVDLLDMMMDVDPATRITAKAALEHPYFHSFKSQSHVDFAPRFLEPNVCDWTLKHKDLSKEMREILLQWLMEVTIDNKSSVETYSQCIEIVDAFMNKTTETIPKERLQLVGIAAMFISSAMNEVNYLSVESSVKYTDNTYTGKELMEMSCKIFNCLEHLMPQTKLQPEVIKISSLEDMYKIYENYCSSFPKTSPM